MSIKFLPFIFPLRARISHLYNNFPFFIRCESIKESLYWPYRPDDSFSVCTSGADCKNEEDILGNWVYFIKRERKRAMSGCYNECAWGVMTSNFKSEKLITRRKTVSEKDGFNTVVGRWVRVSDAEVHKPLH